ncbi:Lysine exporter protein (LYSE/YGGA) [Denitrovibrio acetiphilus DSM 12809]|uniref:Lysine exporter protein (LYSE/YGGA) n=1 Tax=Denitrovibrio acetiphilus (strain DSM 12809 / NBRC 114555 / N2460) TaxID=522772 RepID=D4H621_DENA2|nr:LysE family translocator [Denitrovibrio acetiphilus]ADD67667.1 Lysine exporter protein (LYSE/YGGA) [Denitrovibrio acetiphilus DSM 12809]
MTVESSITFFVAMSLFVASPGPGVMGCVAVAMRQNIKNSVAFIVGMIAGDLVYLLFAVFGLTALASNFNFLFQVVRMAGGAYMLFLAYKMWRFVPEQQQIKMPSRKRGNFFAGLFITLSNPKVIIFYCGFLPNFMNLASLSHIDLLIVSLLVSFVIVVVMGSYSVIAGKTGGFLSRRSGKVLNRSAGTALAATGTYMIFKQ